ncbi:MAG: oxidoreductase, partial [Solirubrobacteraceae bacterium]
HPLQFTFNFLTRSGRISYDNVRERDPKFGDAFDRWYASTAARLRSPLLVAPSPLFTEHHFQESSVANRAVLAVGSALGAKRGVPSRAYSAALMHRAQGGAGLVMTDVLAVDPSAAISPADAGLYSEDCAVAWQQIVQAVREKSDAKLMASIGHAGSRGATAPRTHGVDRPLARGGWPLISASGLRYTDRAQSPRAMTASDMAVVCQQFCSAASRAARAGFDLLELHAGHGYLLSSFLSPLTNKREDEYGGDLEGRLRFPLEVLAGVRARWAKPLAVCFTAHDCVRDGNTDQEAVEIACAFRECGCDLVHVVAGQTVARGQPGYDRHFLAPYADRIRNEAHIPVLVGGRINSIDDANTVLAGGRADLCIIDLPGLSEFDQQTSARLGSEPIRPAKLHEVAATR